MRASLDPRGMRDATMEGLLIGAANMREADCSSANIPDPNKQTSLCWTPGREGGERMAGGEALAIFQSRGAPPFSTCTYDCDFVAFAAPREFDIGVSLSRSMTHASSSR